MDDIQCSGPKPDTALTLQAGTTVSAPEFIRRHMHSPSTLTLFETMVSRIRTGNYWFSAPEIAPFNCSKNGVSMEAPWFSERFTLVFFCEQKVVPISFIGKVRPDGSERLVHLNLAGTIRYFVATAPQTTCIYRSVTDVERYEEEQRRKEEERKKEEQREKQDKNNPAPIKSSSTPQPILSAIPMPWESTPKSPNSVPSKAPGSPQPSCTCTCDAGMNRFFNNSGGESIPKGPWFGPIPSKRNSTRNRQNWIRRQQKAPYAPRPYPDSGLGSTLSPVHSWRWSWFWCMDPRERVPIWEKEHSIQESGERACFPSSATVETLERGHIRMDELRIGDSVRMGPDELFSRVFMFTHSDKTVWRKFVNLTTAGGLSITLSPGHILPADDELIRADDVKVGQTLNTDASKNDVVISVERVSGQGLFNPQTESGTILVDGVHSSCYTTEVIPPVAQALLAPLRAFYNVVPQLFKSRSNVMNTR